MITKVTIYGERCSGTNYLEELLLLNFDVEIVWDYGWKHFFGFNNLTGADDVLFIGIIRNLEDWINSLYRIPHHLPSKLTESIDTFLTDTFYSTTETGDDILSTDLNMETNQKYKNIFELRRYKNLFLIEKMPLLVENYCLITYDDLINNFVKIMNKIKECGLQIKHDIEFPLNISYYKKEKTEVFIKKVNEISSDKIKSLMGDNKELLYYENLLFHNGDTPSAPTTTHSIVRGVPVNN